MSSSAVETVATVALAVVAATALGLNVWQVGLTRRALKAAFESVQEVRRSRIDARAPRVVVHEAPQPIWPPAQAQPVVAAGRNNLASGTRFDLPGDAGRRLLLSTYVCLHNEGGASAFITMPPGGVRVGTEGDRPNEAGEEILNWARGQSLSYRLAPGQSSWFLLEAGYTLEQWAYRWHMFEGKITSTAYGAEPDAVVPGARFVIEVRDQFLESFRDMITVDILAFPVEPIPSATDGWIARTTVATTLDTVARTQVVGVRREYDEVIAAARRTVRS
jgi:hypothetical protein